MDLIKHTMNNTAPATQPAGTPHNFLAPVFAQYPLEVVSAEGVWLRNRIGERILDLYGGHAVASLGYGHPGWTAALAKQAESCNFQTNAVPMAVRVRAAERLIRFFAARFHQRVFCEQRRGSERERHETGVPDDLSPPHRRH